MLEIKTTEADASAKIIVIDVYKRQGVYSRVEIWSKDRYLENTDFDDMDEIAEHMAELGIGI